MPTGMNQPHVQDWGAVNVGSGSLNKASVPKTARGIDAAKAAGKIATEKRFGAGGNTGTHTIMSARKLDDATEAGTIAKVDKSLSKAIMQARTAKKLSQKDLATAINEKATTIQQYESGKAIPNPQIIGKLERKLGCKLPRPGKSKAAPKDGKKPAPKGAGITRGGPPKRR